ncbi:MAG: hypothetical protein KJ698_00235, partial [Actinobacteria bacterium]|nr:hypothetical protein [Actinomycetota bacterium]
GKALGSEFRVSPKGATGTEADPGISWAWTGTSEFLVVWIDRRKPARGFDVYGRRLSAAGTLLGGSFRISNAGGGHNEFGPALAWSSATDEYLVVWEDERRSGTRGTDIYGRRVLDGGGPVGGDFRISGRNAITDDADPGIAYSRTSSEYLVVWSDARSYATRAEDIYGRRLDPSGTPAGNDFRVSGPNAIGAESDPRPAFLYDAAGFLVVWPDDRDADNRSFDVWGRRVTD